MSESNRRPGDERKLLLAGVMGLAIAAVVVCCSDDADESGDQSADAGPKAGSGGGKAEVDAGASTKPDASTGAGGGACEHASSTDANAEAVVTAAKALLAALTDDQKKAIQYDKKLTAAEQWSNLPTTFVARNGVKIGDMSGAAQEKAVALASVAAGDIGGKLLSEVRDADEWLVTDGKAQSSDYGRGLYYFAFVGEPSTSSSWLLQIAGHHLAYNFSYSSKCTSATPMFDGVEPTDWKDGSVEHKPLETQRAAMVALLDKVSGKSGAKLSGSFGDLINGPTGGMPGGGGSSGDTKYPSKLTYPTTGRGAAVSSFSDSEKALVKTAIEAWVKNVADPVSAALLSAYESDAALAETYIGYAGNADLTTQGSYVRIDGPRVWIEVTIQGGIVYRDKVHYHTIWRDKEADYGAEYVEE